MNSNVKNEDIYPRDFQFEAFNHEYDHPATVESPIRNGCFNPAQYESCSTFETKKSKMDENNHYLLPTNCLRKKDHLNIKVINYSSSNSAQKYRQIFSFGRFNSIQSECFKHVRLVLK